MKLRYHLRYRDFSIGDYSFLLIFVVACILLILGLTMPAFTNDRLGHDPQSLSILRGAVSLSELGSPGFMIIIILFSAVFPTAKLIAMLVLWLFSFEVDSERRIMRWLEILGKWSMLDVFVIATTIGASHLKLLNKTTIETGIYVFGLAIFISMLASVLLRKKFNAQIILSLSSISVPERILGIVIGVLSLLLFFTGIMLPLFSIKKWLFWNKDYSLITALPDMLKEQVYLLPLMVLVFVIVLPLCRFIALTLTRMIPVPPPRLVKLAYGFEKWTMWEVYALALVIVAIKLGDFTELEFRAGFWLIIAVMPLSLLDGWLFNRRMEFRLIDDC
ncbi:MAG: paraquat-inducible protein A [Gammaproteobacteria bacterium]|nr:paraquat-inducible protein A [Gammaproteobacteria bacterium]